VPEEAGRRLPPLPAEVAAVWILFAAVAAEILVTYSRLPARELYHVSGSGLAGGSSRVAVFANFPVALVAIAVLALLADRTASSRRLTLLAVAGIALSAAVFWPGVVSEADLDARWVNAVAGLGVLVALALSAVLLTGGLERTPAQRGDSVRALVAAAALLVALPWAAADLGLFLDGVPLLGRVFETARVATPGAGPAVHHGHHHGMDGTLLLLTALLLSRVVPSVRRRALRIAVGAYLSLMVAYALGNIANDLWTEQVLKRGRTSWEIPNVLEPRLTPAWGLIVLGAAVLYAVAARGRRGRPRGPSPGRATPLPGTPRSRGSS
jgi:hypothetical protein